MPGTMTRWDPAAELGELRGYLDRVFGGFAVTDARSWKPAIDVVRDDGNLVVQADIPGFTADDITVEVEDDILTVSGEHEESSEAADSRYVTRERKFGSFARSVALPAGVDPHKITAETHDGVIKVTIPIPHEGKQGPVTIRPTAG